MHLGYTLLLMATAEDKFALLIVGTEKEQASQDEDSYKKMVFDMLKDVDLMEVLTTQVRQNQDKINQLKVISS